MTAIVSTAATISSSTPVEILILGAGWTSTFLLPLLTSLSIPFAATTRSGSSTTIPFTFDPASPDPAPYQSLPHATTVLIAFPIKVPGGSTRLVDLYRRTHPSSTPTRFLQLGSTSIWSSPGTSTRRSPIDGANERGRAEAELLALGGTVLNLSGLWGGARQPRNWVARVAPTKERLALKGSLHVVHGEDVARAVVAVHGNWEGAQRWLLTDLRSYDWWDLAVAWGVNGEAGWALELMREEGVRVLPRGVEERGGKVLDSAEFWERFGIRPGKCLLV